MITYKIDKILTRETPEQAAKKLGVAISTDDAVKVVEDQSNDISLVYMTAIKGSKYLKDIEVAKIATRKDAKGKELLFYGYGYNSVLPNPASQKATRPDKLQRMKMMFADDKVCIDSTKLPRSAICMEGINAATCKGDSGGPLHFCEDKKSINPGSTKPKAKAKQCYVVGVVSRTASGQKEKQLCKPGSPTIFTAVAEFGTDVKSLEKSFSKAKDLKVL
jgi:hypothetical protein